MAACQAGRPASARRVLAPAYLTANAIPCSRRGRANFPKVLSFAMRARKRLHRATRLSWLSTQPAKKLLRCDMHVVITLGLDAASADRVAGLQALLSARGISDYAAQLGYGPHLSLLRYDDLETEAILPVVSRLAPQIPSLPIYLEGVCVFASTSPVLWLAPAANAALLSLHSHLYASLSPHIAHRHYQPGRWVPHVTLAEGLDRSGAAEAIAAILPIFLPIEGQLESIEVLRCPPATVIWSAQTQAVARLTNAPLR